MTLAKEVVAPLIVALGLTLPAAALAQPEPALDLDEEPEPKPKPLPQPEPEPEPEPEPKRPAKDATAKPSGDGDAADAKKAKEEDKPPSEDRWSWLHVGAYFRPNFRVLYRPTALPRDRMEYRFRGSVGLVLDAKPFDMWRAELDVVFSDEVVRAVTDVAEEGSLVSKQSVPGAVLQDAFIAFEPVSWFGILAGAMRIPFSLQTQSANTELVFPNRSEPNQVFQSGSDFGAMLYGNFADGVVITSLGAFNGDSLGLGIPGTTEQGAVFSARLDINPFGKFAFGEGDYGRGPFRLGVGGGMLVRPITLFDQGTGTEERSAVELRFAASLRMAVRGLYFGAEYFRRQRLDDFTNRPEVADGAYAQAGYFFPIAEVLGLEPIARAGFVALDQTFDPRLVGFLEAGINVLPVLGAERPDMVRVGAQYFGERRFTEEEEAHGAVLSAQLSF